MASAPILDTRTADALRQAIGAAQRGDIVQARSTARAALAEGGDVAALNAFLGMLSARGGDLTGAISHLRAAHGARPDDATIACNLIAALIDSTDLVGALEVARLDLARRDASLRIARYRGFAAQSLERFDEAVEAYEHVVRLAPQDFESWNNLGNARAATGDLQGSVAALEQAMALDPQAPPTRLNLALALRSADRADEAEALLKRTADDFPDDARALHELYVQYKKEARQEDAMAAIEAAVARDGENANLQLKFAIECGLAERIEDAERAFHHVLALDAREVDAYLGLAVQYEHTNREQDFAPLIARAEANGIAEEPLAFLRALEARRQGKLEEALALLAKVPSDVEPERTAHLRGTMLDRLARTDEAFAAFVETNERHQASPSKPLERAAELRAQLRSELELMTPEWRDVLPSIEISDDLPTPVFLVGFPRSGTTLLDTILMGHPDVVVMEEKPPLNFIDHDIGGAAGIAALDADAIAAARARYFREAADYVTLEPGKLLVDKSPLFLNKAALVHRLFPEAKFILALRHPCDALFSCFMSNFRLNTAMSNFLRLEDAAEFYDLNFRHWERSRALFDLPVHTIVYEQLIEHVGAEVRPLFDFLGLEWHADALDHQRTARARGLITTASYSQVTEPIYKRAAGRWTRYRTHLDPILPVLAPWVEKFGYSL